MYFETTQQTKKKEGETEREREAQREAERERERERGHLFARSCGIFKEMTEKEQRVDKKGGVGLLLTKHKWFCALVNGG